MNYEDLIAKLRQQRALIVHCSRPGQGDKAPDTPLFPEDLFYAIKICAEQNKELCCSVIWPGHMETFGDVGIVLKPRSIASVTMICTTDGGTHIDRNTGRRVGSGLPFGPQAVADTFENATGYNEWNVRDADTIGIFVKSRNQPLEVAALTDLTRLHGYAPVLDTNKFVGSRYVGVSEIADRFPRLPIYFLEGGEIVDLHGRIASPYAA